MINSEIIFKIRDKRLPLSFLNVNRKNKGENATYSTTPNDKSETIFK